MSQLLARVLRCTNSHHAPACDFVLGYDGVLPTSDYPPLLSKENPVVAVVCPCCFEVSEYSQRDIRTVELDTPIQYPPHTRYTWRIEAQCAQKSCGFRQVVHFQVDVALGSALWKEMRRGRAQILCPICGHKTLLDEQPGQKAAFVGLI